MAATTDIFRKAVEEANMQEKLLVQQAVETHVKTTQILENAARTVLETEEIAKQSAQELNSQEETLIRVLDGHREIQATVGKTDRVLTKLERSCCWACIVWCCCCCGCCGDDEDTAVHKGKNGRRHEDVPVRAPGAPYQPPAPQVQMNATSSTQALYNKGPDTKAFSENGYADEALRIQQETQQQDKLLSQVDGGLDRLKYIAQDMNTTLTTGNARLDALNAATDNSAERLKKAEDRTKRLLGK